MIINKKKLARQEICLQNYYKSFCQGIIQAVPGFGKTYIGIMEVRNVNKDFPNEQIVVIVPTTKLKDDWEAKAKKHLLKNVHVYVVNTYVNMDNTDIVRDCVLLILDEIHRYSNEEAKYFSQVLEITKAKRKLGLTGTLEKQHREFLSKHGLNVVDTVDSDEAEREGYISKSLIFNLMLDLESDEYVKYQQISDEYQKRFSYFGFNYNILMGCLQSKHTYKKIKIQQPFPTTLHMNGEECREWYAKQMGWGGEKSHKFHPDNIAREAVNTNRIINTRKQFLYNCDTKFNVLKELIETFDMQTIVFSESSYVADKLEQVYPDIAKSYHTAVPTRIRLGSRVLAYAEKVNKKTLFKGVKSGKLFTYEQIKKIEPRAKKVGSKVLLREALELFESALSPVRVLSTVRKLDEGFNVENIELVIMHSYTSTKRQDQQRKGRGVRVDYTNPNKTAIVINLVVRNTKEEDWVKYKQEGTSRIISVDSIKALQEVIQKEKEGEEFVISKFNTSGITITEKSSNGKKLVI